MSTAAQQGNATVVAGHFSHSFRELDHPKRWTIFVSHHDDHVKRLVVFVHGFRGESVGTWMDFPMIDASRPENLWWFQSDCLFIGYNSTKETITGVANRINRELPRFYPQPLPEAMNIYGARARRDTTTPYDELIVVGHSLGGVILRRALCDAAQEWIDNGRPADHKPILLNATTRLFSPASAGFQPSGWLGLLRATGVWDRAIEIFLRRSPAYSDLQRNSEVLREIRESTLEKKPKEDTELSALRARILWANPDGVVVTERYTTDFTDDSWDDSHHISICKPRTGTFEAPWRFVQTGKAY